MQRIPSAPPPPGPDLTHLEDFVDDQQDEYVAALQAERDGYAARGQTDRVKTVDAELARVKRAAAGGSRTAAPVGAASEPPSKRSR